MPLNCWPFLVRPALCYVAPPSRMFVPSGVLSQGCLRRMLRRSLSCESRLIGTPYCTSPGRATGRDRVARMRLPYRALNARERVRRLLPEFDLRTTRARKVAVLPEQLMRRYSRTCATRDATFPSFAVFPVVRSRAVFTHDKLAACKGVCVLATRSVHRRTVAARPPTVGCVPRIRPRLLGARKETGSF